MSKKTPVKKSKRRLKRSVRRSFAAALMITAIAVAAIPVPENYAVEETPGSGSDTPAVSTAEAYKYPDADTMDNYAAAYSEWVPLDVNRLKPNSSDTKYTTHYISSTTSATGTVSYRMEWQFEYFLQKVNNVDKGIICDYNNNYSRKTLNIEAEPIHEYVVIPSGSASTKGTFENFKSRHQNDPFSLQENPSESDPQDLKFKKYFPDDYNAQVEKYRAYETALADYETKLKQYQDGTIAEPPVKPQKADYWTATRDLERTAADFSSINDDYYWRLYYCDVSKADTDLPDGIPDTEISRFTSLEGYILVRVIDAENVIDGVTQSCYVPQRIEPSEIDLKTDDEYGFKIRNWASFIGIGDEAFYKVGNVENVTLDEDSIRYIGESAFEGSFIRSIRMMNLDSIGNYAFKNCPNLSSIEMVQGVKYIGTEAFYGLTLVREITFPSPVEYIGPGAFANCALLSKIDFSAATNEVVIDDYAFYNDGALNEVDFMIDEKTCAYITTIGKAAFAVWSGASGNLTEFVFPTWISQNRESGKSGYNYKGLGDYILAGRTNLKDVTMPSDYGKTEEIKLPGHIFQNCIALDRVNFPDTGGSCGFVTFDPDIFASVSNPKFIVQGPPYTEPSNKEMALPRRATWVAYTAAASIKNNKRVPNVPYIYYLNGVRYTEICDGDYLMCIDNTGVLTSCSLHPDKKSVPEGSVDLIIPAEVAGTPVTAIGPTCFAGDKDERDERKMSKAVRSLTVMDDSKLATIGDGVFANWENLARVYLGNSVRTVGDNAFLNCLSLVDVYFNTPEDVAAAKGAFTMGDSAFQTNSLELTFHGPISTNFAPYERAVLQNTIIDDYGKGKRICYKSLAPTYLTVMYDNQTKVDDDGSTYNPVTLLDYPKYDQIASILGEYYAVKNGYYIDSFFDPEEYYREYMESMYYSAYSSTQYDSKRAAFRDAWSTAADGEADKLYENFELYGPWISPDWIARTDFTATTSSNATENASVGSAIADFFFEPITAQAATGKPDGYFKTYPYNVYENLERNQMEAYGDYQRYTTTEYNLLKATRNITVPDGVTSIDVNGFMYAEPNVPNLSYLEKDRIGKNTFNMYNTNAHSTLKVDRENDIYGGLFSGDYTDYKGTTDKENLNKGNDRLVSINLNQVKSLPAYAFDSCENLEEVTIGKDCKDIKELPFRGCTSLTTLNIEDGNPYYKTENRILYSTKTEKNDGSYRIEECLETRGTGKDNSAVLAETDGMISSVSEIANAAFEECNDITTIDLSSAINLGVIPESCFRGCESLSDINLPLSVNKIDRYAFYDDILDSVQIPGREVFISTEAFKHEDGKNQKTKIVTYADSSARRYADTYEDAYQIIWRDLGELWTVKFFDSDGTLLKTIQIEDKSQSAVKTKDVPTKEELEEKHPGYTFKGWIGTNNVDIEDIITQDTNFVAQYTSNSPMIGGKWTINFYDGITTDSIWPTQYVEDGKTIADTGDASFPPSAPYHEGYKFIKFVVAGAGVDFTENTEVTGNFIIMAVYEVDGAGNAGGNGTTSGSSTANNGGSTGNTSGSTTNTSGSSTATTSAAGEKARHTVTVVNGYGSGSYAEGETVIIVANEPAEGQKFSQWRTESEGVELVMILASATTFVMPANNVLVTAEFTAGSAKPTTTALQTPASGTVATNTGNGTTGNSNNGNTRVDITKPGISNKNLATANVNGSTDNFIVKISETPEATQAVVNALANKYGSLDNILYYAMDISLYDSTGTTKITDTTGLSVDITIPIPDALVAYGGNNMMGAVVGNDQLEDMSERFTTIGGVPCISFTATHFSPYTIYVNTQNLSEGLLDITPKTGDPIHPKWFLSIGLAALSIILFMKKDKKTTVKTA